MVQEVSDVIIRKGNLGVQKKKGTELRFFVLFKDRLDYFTTEEDVENESQPRGRLSLDEVHKLEVTEGGFSLQLAGGQSLTLKTSDGQTTKLWLDSLQPLLASDNAKPTVAPESPAPAAPSTSEALCSGHLNVERKGKVISPFFVLKAGSLDRYENASDYESGKEPRGSMGLADVERLETKELGFSISVRGEKRPLEMRCDNDKDFKLWLRSFENLLAQRLGESFVVGVDGGSDTAAPTDSGHASASGGTTPRDAKEVLCEGALLVIKKSKEEPRYFVLYRDHFEYYSVAADYERGMSPRGRAMHSDISDFEVADGGVMVLKLGEKRLELKASSGEELARWSSAWQSVLGEERPATPHESPEQGEPKAKLLCDGKFKLRKSIGAKEVEPIRLALREDGLEYFKADVDSVDGEPSCKILTDEIDDLEVEDDGFIVHLHDGRTLHLFDPEGMSTDEWLEHFGMILEEDDSASRTSSVQHAQTVPATLADGHDDEVLVQKHSKDIMHVVKTVSAFFRKETTMKGKVVKDVKSFFQALDPDNTGQISIKDLVNCLNHLNIGLKEEQVESMVLAMDEDHNGGIELHELEKVLSLKEEEATHAAKKVLRKRKSPKVTQGNDGNRGDNLKEDDGKRTVQLQSALQRYKFEDIDKDADGIISRADFERFQQEIATKAVSSRSFPGELPEPEEESSFGRPARFGTGEDSIHEGPVECGWEQKVGEKHVEKRYALLSAEKLTLFRSEEDVGSAAPFMVLALTDIQIIKVNQSVFDMQASAGEIRNLHVRCRQGFDAWKSAFEQAMAPLFKQQSEGVWLNTQGPARRLEDSQPKKAEAGSGGSAGSAGGDGSVLHQGPLKIAAKNGLYEVRYFIVQRDRFEYYSDAAAVLRGATPGGRVYATDVNSVRVVDNAFNFGLRSGQSLEIRLPVGEDMEPWVSAFQGVFQPQKDTFQSASNVDDITNAIKNRHAFLKDLSDTRHKLLLADAASEMNDERVKSWLQNLPERPVHSGLLGFQHRGRLAPRLSILFKDRLDSWSSPVKAVNGAREDSRIMLNSVRGVETISAGFILNLGGKKVGIHVGDNEGLHKWSSALLHVLAPSSNQAPLSPTQASFTPGAGDNSGLTPSSPRTPRGASPATPRTPRKPADWVPRAATVYTASRKSAVSKINVPGPSRISVITCHEDKDTDTKKSFRVNTNKAGLEAAKLIHGKAETCVMTTPSRPGAQRYLNSDISGKINERSSSAPALRRSSSAETFSYAEKVTGRASLRACTPRSKVDTADRFSYWKINTEEVNHPSGSSCFSPRNQALTPRGPPPRDNDAWSGGLNERPLTPKVQEAEFHGLAARRRSSEPEHFHGVHGKISGGERKPLESRRRSYSTSELTAKVTDGDKLNGGVPRVSLADKVKSMSERARPPPSRIASRVNTPRATTPRTPKR